MVDDATNKRLVIVTLVLTLYTIYNKKLKFIFNIDIFFKEFISLIERYYSLDTNLISLNVFKTDKVSIKEGG